MDQWQNDHGMTDEEFCACLYEFAPMLRGSDNKISDLPRPTNIWLTGASKGDIKMLESMDDSTTSIWACNERTRRGDVVILYALAPHSCIHSIWRAGSGGTFNPFDHYHHRTTVVNGIKVPEVSLKEMHEDSVIGALPMMNNNLQGINGKEFPSSAYESLLKIIERKGGDISSLPVICEMKNWNPGIIKKEKDVEEKILIPCLKELGYQESDWTRQLNLKAGRGLKAIPDFVFFPSGREYFEVAPLVIEAKKDMSSSRERIKAFDQGDSYAKMLTSELMGICDESRLIIYRKGKNDTFDYTNPVFESHWAAITGDSTVFAELKKLIGAEIIRTKNFGCCSTRASRCLP